MMIHKLQINYLVHLTADFWICETDMIHIHAYASLTACRCGVLVTFVWLSTNFTPFQDIDSVISGIFCIVSVEVCSGDGGSGECVTM